MCRRRPWWLTWSPPGYNPAYGLFELNAAGNALQVTLAPSLGMVRNPMLVINNFTAAGARVDINGSRATPDVDYFASVDATGQRLWLTLKRDVQASVVLAISENPVLFEDGFE